MNKYHVIVIGGGILGCFAARNLRRWNISTLLLEKEEDVCMGITRANSAIVYAGYDNKPGSRKAVMTVRGNAEMERLCGELHVPYSRCGSLLVTYDPASVEKLQKKYRNGIANGVPGMQLLSGAEAEAMEPMLKKGVAGALYAPSTGTVNPWQLGIAAFENACTNGAEALRSTEVTGIRNIGSGYEVTTDKGVFFADAVVNCGGLYADRLQEMVFAPTVRLNLDGAEYLVLDSLAEKPSRVIFHQADACGKGITAIPCVEGNLLISGVRKELGIPFATTSVGIRELKQDAKALLPDLDVTAVIRSFGAVRPNPYMESGADIHDFSIENPAPGFYSLIGIKTPGLTCANGLSRYLAEQVAEFLDAEENPSFDPVRRPYPPKDNEIICQCEQITKAEILEAIRRGADSVEGVKRRVGSGMGRCQGSRCSWKIGKLLEDAKHGIL